MVEVTAEVICDVLGIRQQSIESEWRHIVEVVARSTTQESILDLNTTAFERHIHLDNLVLCSHERIGETLDNAHWEDNISVFVGFVCAHQLIGNSPYKVCLLLNVDGGSLL